MDEFLARIYGTGGGGDIEKTAQMHFLQKLAEEEGVDLSGLSDEELQSMYEEVEGQGGEEEQYDVEGQQEALQKEAAAKFEEADFLGRVMAHAYTQELEKIAAGKLGPGNLSGAAEHYARSGAKAVGEGAKKLWGHASTKGKALGGRYSELMRGGAKGEMGEMAGRRAGNSRTGFGQMRGEALKSVAARAGTGLAAVGVEEGIRRGLSKEATAFNKLAMMKAAEMLDAVGIDPQTGQPHEGQQDQAAMGGQQRPGMQSQTPQQPAISPQMIAQEMARRQQGREQQMQGSMQQQPGMQDMQGQQEGGQDEQFETQVNQRALEMLQQAGYNPEAVVEALTGGQGAQ